MKRLPTLLTLLLGAIACARVASVWDGLPPAMASHFGGDGRPDAWLPRTGFFLFYGGVVGGTVALLLALPALLRRVPARLLNVPHPEYWATPERLPEAMALLGRKLAWFGFAMALFAVATLELVLRANLARAPLDSPRMGLLLGAYGTFVLGWLVGFFRAFRPPLPAAERGGGRR